MKTRKFEEYNTDFSNTARLDKSTIPYICKDYLMRAISKFIYCEFLLFIFIVVQYHHF